MHERKRETELQMGYADIVPIRTYLRKVNDRLADADVEKLLHEEGECTFSLASINEAESQGDHAHQSSRDPICKTEVKPINLKET